MRTTILHLSDIHIGEAKTSKDEIEELRDNIVNSLEGYAEINMIVVTGDIFDSKPKSEEECILSEKEEIQIAKEYFEYLSERLGIKKEDILFVPGNHDMKINGTESDGLYRYRKFLDAFYTSKGDVDKLYRLDKKMVIKKYKERKLLLFGFNSSLIKNGSKNEGTKIIEKITEEQFREVLSYIQEKGEETLNDYYKIVFFHHPFELFPEESEEIKGVITNSNSVTKELSKLGVELVLHGHTHLALTSLNRPKGANIYVVGGGTVRKNIDSYRSFNIINLDTSVRKENEIKLEKFQADDSNCWKFNSTDIIDLNAYFHEGMLCNKLKMLKSSRNLAITATVEQVNIIKMINELYQSYGALNILGYGNREINNNMHVLLFSVKYRAQYRKYRNSIKFQSELNKEKELYYQENKEEKSLKEEGFKHTLEKIAQFLKINDIYEIEKIRQEIQDNTEIKRYYAFALVAAFFTDLYYDFTEDWKITLKNQEGVSFETADSIDTVRFNGTGIRYENKIIYVRLTCNSQDTVRHANKVLDLSKRRLSAIEEYFWYIKLKVTNLVIDIETWNESDVKYYNYNAAILHLIPILTGTNIYASDLAFARELIQNAIDAIAFREKREKDFNKKIKIKMATDKYGQYFSIEDSGIGMTEETIERYFTTLGRSYYKEYNDITETNVNYNAISNFGIGFFSVFKLCKEVKIQTKPFDETGDIYYELNMEKNKDVFSIKAIKDEKISSGTKITCYFENNIDADSIVDYINKTMLDVKYTIEIEVIKSEKKKNRHIPPRHIRDLTGLPRILIPFNERNGDVERENDNLNLNDYNSAKYEYGFFICPTSGKCDEGKNGVEVLNAGILMKNADLAEIFSVEDTLNNLPLRHNRVIINFPPNWLSIDVSREKATQFNEKYAKNAANLKIGLHECFKIQLRKYLENNKNVLLSEISEMINFMSALCGDKPDTLLTQNGKIVLNVELNDNEILFRVRYSQNIFSLYGEDDIYYGKPKGENSNYNSLYQRFHKLTAKRWTSELKDIEKHENKMRIIKESLIEIGVTDFDESQWKYFVILLSAGLKGKRPDTWNDETYEDDEEIKEKIKQCIMETCTIADLEKEVLFSVKYDTNKIYEIQKGAKYLETRVEEIAEYYGAAKTVDKYEFIQEKIIHKAYDKYSEETNHKKWKEIKDKCQSIYEALRDEVKALYAKDSNSRIEFYHIAACYMGSLMKVPDNYLRCREDKFKWVLDSGLDIVYMWKLSEYKEEGGERYEKLKSQGKLELPENKYDEYISLLKLKDAYTGSFDVLYFSELLFWAARYCDEQLSLGD